MTAPQSDSAAIRQTIRALKAGGYELDSVWDGEESTPVATETEAVAIITGLDQAHLYVYEGGVDAGYVFFVLGNDPEEVICDYTTNLTVIDTLTDGWWK